MSNLVKINEYEEFRNQVAAVKDTCDFLPDVSTDEGYNKSKRVALDVGKILTAVEKKRKELKSESIAVGKAIDTEAKEIVAEVEAFMLPHKNAYKELDTLKKERDASRKQELSDRVEVIRLLPESMADSDSEGIKMALESLQQEECLDFYEFTAEALKARNASRDALGNMFAVKLKEEQDAIELAKLKKEQAEREQKEREDKIASDAAAEADAAKREAEDAKQKAVELAAEAVKQREAAEAKAKVEAENAEFARIEAEEAATLRADKAAEDAKQEQIRQQEAKEEADRVEQEKREANTKHISKIRKEAKDCLMEKHGLSEAQAKDIIKSIHTGEIKNISINY